MKKLKKKYKHIDEKVIKHVYEEVCGKNDSLVGDILGNMSTTEINQLKTNLNAPKVEPKKMEVVKEKRPGLFSKTEGSEIPLVHVDYSISMSDFVGKISCVQKFINKKENPLELIYRFPLISEISTLFSVEIDLFDPATGKKKHLSAKVKGKERAKEEYDDSVSSGNAAMLMEKEDPEKNLVTLNLGNVLPGVHIDVTISTAQEIKFEEQKEGKMKLKLAIPSILKLKKGDVDGELEMEQGFGGEVAKNTAVECLFNLKIGKIESITFPGKDGLLERVEDTEDENVVKYKTKDDIAFGNDFEIVADVSGIPRSSCVIQKISDDKKCEYSHACLVSMLPRNVEKKEMAINSEIIVIIGSMGGSRMKYSKEALNFFLQSLDPDDNIKINLVRFGTRFDCLYPDPRLLSEETFQDALKFCRETKSNYGGTNMCSPVENILSKPITKGFTRQVWLITDGEDGNPLRLIQIVKRSADNTRFFSLGVGRETSQFLLKEIARNTNGRAAFIQKSEGINEVVLEQLNYALQPAVLGVDVEFPESVGKVKKMMERVPVVFYGSCHVQYYFLSKVPDDLSVKLSYVEGGGSERAEIDLKPLAEAEVEGVDVLGVNKRVSELQKYGKDKQNDQKEILELGLMFNLLTSETSFFLECENETEIQKELVVEEVPSIQYIDHSKVSDSHRRHAFLSGRNRLPLMAGKGSSANWRRVRDGKRLKKKYGGVFSGHKTSARALEQTKMHLESNYMSNQLSRNIDKVLDRGESLQSIEDKCEELSSQSQKFYAKSSSLQGQGRFSNFFSGIGKAVSGLFSGGSKSTSVEGMSPSATEAKYMGISSKNSIGKQSEKVVKGPELFECAPSMKVPENQKGECLMSGSDDDDLFGELDSLEGDIDWGGGIMEDSPFKLPTSGEKLKNKKDGSGKQSMKKKGGTGGMSLSERIKNIQGGKLNKIILSQSLKGTWPLAKEIAQLIEIPFKKISTSIPEISSEANECLWMTAILIVYLAKNYPEKEIQYRLIVKKAKKALKKAGVEKYLEAAEKFILQN